MQLKRKSSVAGSFFSNCPQTSDTLLFCPVTQPGKGKQGRETKPPPGPGLGAFGKRSLGWGVSAGGRTLNAHTEPVPVYR